MTRSRKGNGKQSKLDYQQLQFPSIDPEIVSGNNELPAQSKRQSQRKTRDGSKPPSGADTLNLTKTIKVEFARLESRIAAFEALLKQVAVGTPPDGSHRKLFSVKEAAAYLGKKIYTVREWCRFERINAVKAQMGRGFDNEWRISCEELVRYQNEGLLPIKKDSDIRRPKRPK
jgi:hypothetical protein